MEAFSSKVHRLLKFLMETQIKPGSSSTAVCRLNCRLFGEQFKDQNCTYCIHLLHDIYSTLVTIHIEISPNHWFEHSKFRVCPLIFVIIRCHVSLSKDNRLLIVNFDLLTQLASCMLLCNVCITKNIKSAAVCILHAAFNLPCSFCILIPQQNH